MPNAPEPCERSELRVAHFQRSACPFQSLAGSFHVYRCTPVYGRTQVAQLRAPANSCNIGRVGLRERLQDVMDERGWNPAEWAKRAKLKERTHLNTILRRLDADPASGVAVQVLVALADAAGVSLDWLATGRLPKYIVRTELDQRYPSRSVAIAAARLLGVDERAITLIAAVDDVPVDPGGEYWTQRLFLAARELPPPPAPKALPPARKGKTK